MEGKGAQVDVGKGDDFDGDDDVEGDGFGDDLISSDDDEQGAPGPEPTQPSGP